MSTIIARNTLEVILNTLVCAGIIYCEAAGQVASDLDSGMDWEEVVNAAERYMQPSEFKAFSKAILPWCIPLVLTLLMVTYLPHIVTWLPNLLLK